MGREEIELLVRREIQQILGDATPISGSKSLAAAGLDSLHSVQLTLCLEDAFEVVFDDEEIRVENFADIDSIVGLLQTKVSG